MILIILTFAVLAVLCWHDDREWAQTYVDIECEAWEE